MWRPDMWPFATRSPYLLRLGQAFIQLWQGQSGAWVQIASQPSHHIAHDQQQAMSDVIRETVQTLPVGAKLQVLADSKWMPVSLILTGQRPLSAEQMQTLARHRFAQVFGEHASHWAIQTDYVGGDTHALAFACPAGLLSTLREGLQTKQFGLEPTLSWAWQKGWPGHARRSGTWLVLAEHDRSVMVWASQGKARALQAAGPVFTSPAQAAKVMQTEALRCGVVEEVHSVSGVSFEALTSLMGNHASDAFRWQVLGVAEHIT